MTRTFKISFPIPGRRPTTSPGIPNNGDGDRSPLCRPGSKAEQVLGASSGDGVELHKSSKKEKKSLRKYPSLMSVTWADMEIEHAPSDEPFPFPGARLANGGTKKPTQTLSSRKSSPLLGERLATGSANTDYFSNPSARRVRPVDSSSILRSHYDRTIASPLVSQQTSSSSARDMALRKGLATIPSSLDDNVLKQPTLTEADKTHTRTLSEESKVSGSSKISANMKIAGTPRRRPSVNDPPTLFPEAPRPFHSVSPPPALINSSVPKSSHPSSFQKPKWFDRNRLETPSTAPPSVQRSTRHLTDRDYDYSSVKIHIKKPKAGAIHWFDGLDDDDTAPEDLQQPESLKKQQLSPPSLGPVTIPEVMSQQPPMKVGPRKSSLSHGSQQSSSIERNQRPLLRLDPSAPRRNQSDHSQQPPTVRSIASSPGGRSQRSTDSGRGIPAGIDLQKQSVLNLSSSEDEDSSAPTDFNDQRRRIRRSIEKSDYGREVLVGNAQRVQPTKPRPVVNKKSRGSSSRKSSSSELVPPVPQIPRRPQLSARTSPLKWKELLEERSPTSDAGESTLESGESSLNLISDTYGSVSRVKMNMVPRGSKMMKVTVEEEKLLEAMRERRAHIRNNEFQKGFHKAMELQIQDLSSRPQKAAADGQSSRSSMHRTRSSISHKRSDRPKESSLASLAGSRLSMSSDNILDDSYPFPQVPENLTFRKASVSRSKPSPSLLSLTHSENPASTSTSHNSPLTPPPEHALNIYGRTSFRVSSGSHRYGHERARTASSGIVSIDGIEQHGKGVSGWETDQLLVM